MTLFVASLFAFPVLAGSSADPEILDDQGDSVIFSPTGTAVPHLEITKAWIRPNGPDFEFAIEVASLDEVPKDAVYVWHYTYISFRFFFRANWTDDGSELQFFGGIYEGCDQNLCPAFDPQGNRNYLYLRGNQSQEDRIRGDVKPGAPARIAWYYPMDSVTEDRRGLAFKGLFVATYTKRDDGSLQYIDIGSSQSDYIHKIYTPWWKKFVPGPNPLVAVGVALALVGLAARRRG